MQVPITSQRQATRQRRPFRPYVASLCLVILLQMLNFTLFLPADRTSHSPEVEAGSAIPYTEVNPYGANTFLSKEVEDWKREKTVKQMSEAGLGWMKQQFPWSEIEPKSGRFWDDKYNQNSWEKYDRIVALAEQYGIRIIARIDNTPDWARDPGTSPQTPPNDFDRFAEFVATFIEHYRGRVQYLQIWNEPNLKVEWGGKLDSAAYVQMLSKVYTRAKQVDPNVVILSAPLAQTLETGDRGLNELVYMQQLYDKGFAKYNDIVMANGYGFDQPPTAAPDPQKLNLRRVELLHQVMERNGDTTKPVWLNEYAWNAAPADWPIERTRWLRVPEEQQAQYTVDGIRYMRERWPWIGVINIWYFRQVGDISPSDAEYYFRMVDTEFTPRPIYNEIARATMPQRLAQVGRYGPLSPVVGSKGRWSTVRSSTGAVAIRSERVGDTITIRFRGNQLVLEGDHSPRGGRVAVTLDGSTDDLRQLPKDERGRRYLDFRDPDEEPVTLTIADNLDPLGALREHEVTLTTIPASDGAAGRVTIRAFEVAYVRSSTVFVIVSGVAALLALGATLRVAQVFGRARRVRRTQDELADA
ncbi:MAG: cellulase family glycosylhydrolase [Chloroflexia bacterium]